MSSSMIYCQCSFCGALPQASTVNNFVAPLEPASTYATLCTNRCKNVTSTTTSEAPETGVVERRDEGSWQKEKLKFGIENILYGSSKADLFGTHLNVMYPTPRSTTRQIHSAPWSRPVFSDHQRKTLEERFQLQHYLNKRDRYHMSLYLGLTEHQIKVWFQNRRVKWRQTQKAEKQRTMLPRGEPAAYKN